MLITVEKGGRRARAARRVIAMPEQDHPFQVVKVEKRFWEVEELEVRVERMEADRVATGIIRPTQAGEAVGPAILGAEVDL